jgi:hypothetical protein
MNASFRQSSADRVEGNVDELAGHFADPSDWFHDDRGQRAQAPVVAG